MRIHGILLVRNGVSSVRAAVLHHLSIGCERIHVLDNGSTDGTSSVLERLARRTPITVERDDGRFDQAERRSALARRAARAGADWVLVFDHDEFWTSRRPLRDVLADAGDRVALRVPITDFAQHRDVLRESPRGLLSITHRAPRTWGPTEGRELMEAGEISFLEVGRTPRLLARPSEEVTFSAGFCRTTTAGEIGDAEGVEILHAGHPARSRLERKAEHGERVIESGFVPGESWEHRRWAEMARTGSLDAEWAALSVDADGCVELPGGQRRRFVRDARYADIARRHVRPRAMQWAARALRRSY